MRLPLIALALTLANAPVLALAEEEVVPGNGVRQPLSGDPGWRAQASVGGGVVMVNSAGGQHYLTPEVTAQAAWRANDLLTYRSRLDFAHRKDGASEIYIENTHTWLSFRPEGTLGTDRAQFVFGIGPSLIFTTTRLHAPNRNVHDSSLRPGFEYGIGLRWMIGKVPVAVDFGGQQRWTRHDFRATVAVGFPLKASRPRSDDAKGGMR